MIGDLVFGLDVKAFEDDSEFVEQALGMFYSTSYDNIRMPIYMLFPWIHKVLPATFTSPKFTQWMIGLYDQAAQLRRESDNSRDDYLNFLIELQNKKNTPMDLIYAHVFTFFLDGFETTSYLLGNAINYLAENQECQTKLRNEVQSYEQITFEDLHRMPYLDAVLNGIPSFRFHMKSLDYLTL